MTEACNGKANRTPIITECASPTPLETLNADFLFVPNKMKLLNLWMSANANIIKEMQKFRVNLAIDK